MVFIAFWILKMAAFQGIWTYEEHHAFPYINFIPISMQQTMFYSHFFAL